MVWTRGVAMVMAGLVALGLAAGVEADETSEAVKRLSAALEPWVTAGEVNGVVLVSSGGRTIYASAHGLANAELEDVNSLETRFDLFSMTKPFTAVMTLQLVGEGKLDLDAPVTRYLPEYRNDTGDRVTVRHLLTHTHGIPDISYDRLPMVLTGTVAEVLAAHASGDPEFEPGSRFEYSGLAGYTILGAIIERVTGGTYEEALVARILAPLGLRDTGFLREGKVVPELATSYMATTDERRTRFFRFRCNGASSIYSTVQDLERWFRAVVGNELLPPELTARMLTPQVPADKPSYGLGWYGGTVALEGQERTIVSASGGGRNVLVGVPADGNMVVLLNNVQCPKADQIALDLLAALYRGSTVVGSEVSSSSTEP